MSYLPTDRDEEYRSDAEQGQGLRYAFQEKRPKRQLSPLQRTCRILAPICIIIAAWLFVCWFLTLGA